MKVIFMGTPEFCVPVLENLVKHHEVICVYTQPPRPAGKGYQLRPTPIHEKAEELGIPVEQGIELKAVAAAAIGHDLAVDVLGVKGDGLAHENVQIFIGDGQHTSCLHRAEKCDGVRDRRARKADAGEKGFCFGHEDVLRLV